MRLRKEDFAFDLKGCNRTNDHVDKLSELDYLLYLARHEVRGKEFNIGGVVCADPEMSVTTRHEGETLKNAKIEFGPVLPTSEFVPHTQLVNWEKPDDKNANIVVVTWYPAVSTSRNSRKGEGKSYGWELLSTSCSLKLCVEDQDSVIVQKISNKIVEIVESVFRRIAWSKEQERKIIAIKDLFAEKKYSSEKHAKETSVKVGSVISMSDPEMIIAALEAAVSNGH